MLPTCVLVGLGHWEGSQALGWVRLSQRVFMLYLSPTGSAWSPNLKTTE